MGLQHRSVAYLVRLKEGQEGAEIFCERDLTLEEEKWVIERVQDSLSAQIRSSLEDAAPQRLDFTVDFLIDAVRPDVHLERTGGEVAFDLLADEEIAGFGMPLEEFKAAVDAVMIGDGHEIHPPRFRGGIDRVR